MIKLLLPILCVSAFTLTACDQNKAFSPKDSMPYDMIVSETVVVTPQSSNLGYRDDGLVQKSKPSQTMLLAYRYHFSFSIPAKNIESVSGKTIEDCQQAGINNCRIVSSAINKQSNDYRTASIELRVDPKWFETYQADLIANSEKGGGSLKSSNVSSEDLTIAISDSGAKLGALKTLRTRLLSLLETRHANLKDLIEVERELARVQGQIEAATARLRVLKTRVSMSEVHLNYQTKAVAASGSSFSGLKYALNNFVETVSNGLAAVITFIAFILPWLLFAIPVFWGVRKLWRRRRARKQKS